MIQNNVPICLLLALMLLLQTLLVFSFIFVFLNCMTQLPIDTSPYFIQRLEQVVDSLIEDSQYGAF